MVQKNTSKASKSLKSAQSVAKNHEQSEYIREIQPKHFVPIRKICVNTTNLTTLNSLNGSKKNEQSE